jgi:DNA polymerase-3 subunit alpha
MTDKPFWSLHTHSKFSVNDALGSVPETVAKAVELGYPALGLTDHRSVSGAVQLYTECRKAGIEPLPGIELDVVPDIEIMGRSDALHLTMAAYSEAGYRNLAKVASLTARRFWYKPLIDFADFAKMAEDGATEGLLVTTGCFFGVLPQVYMRQGAAAADKVAATLAGWFPRVYVELQNHGIEEHRDGLPDFTDDEVLEAMWAVAQRVGLPVLVTRDSHYTNEADKSVHDALKTLVSWSEDPDDAVFPGGGYHMTDADGLKRYFPRYMLDAGLDALAELANKAYVRIPELETFNLKVPAVSLTGDPQTELEDRVYARMPEEHKKNPRYMRPLKAEFDAIRIADQAPYLLLVDEVCTFMRDKTIRYWARGSAVGSLVNWYLGVTQQDPVKHGLRFDRFISISRIKPADVDLDVEHTRRDEVVAFLKSRWAVRQVGSLAKYSLWDDDHGEGDHAKGSLRMRYFATANKKGLPKQLWRDVPKADRDMLYKISELKLYSGYGKHAAGYIVAPNETVLAQLPMAYIASSESFITAYGKKDVERLGFVKLDLLGSRTATAVNIMEEMTGVTVDTVGLSDPQTWASIRNGRTVGIFQLDGFSMMRGCKRLQPRKFDDLVAAQALFRPAMRLSGAQDEFLERKSGRLKVPVRHPDIMTVTKDTYGILLYQEQVMEVMAAIGLDQVELESMLDAVKASNEYSEGAAVAITRMLPRIRQCAHARGWSDADVAWLADGIGGYADYSFNKSHAVSYGAVSYYTAFMRRHHPVAFWTGMFVAYDDSENITKYLAESRSDRVAVLSAHVNRSKVTYTAEPEHNAIRKGLISIKGIGPAAATELSAKAPFTSLTDLAKRVIHNKVTGTKPFLLQGLDPLTAGGQLAALDAANALEGLERDEPGVQPDRSSNHDSSGTAGKQRQADAAGRT